MSNDIQKFVYNNAFVEAIFYTPSTISTCREWFIEAQADNTFVYYNYQFDSFKDNYQFRFRYADQSADRVLEVNQYLVKEKTGLAVYTKEQFEAKYTKDDGDSGGTGTTDPGGGDPVFSGNTFQITSTTAIKGILIVGTGLLTGIEEYANYIRIDDVNADAQSAPVTTLGEYKWINSANQEPVPTTSTSLAKLLDNADRTRSLIFGAEGDPKLEVLYAVGVNSKVFSMFGITEEFFLASGSSVTINYVDGTSYTHTVTGTGVNSFSDPIPVP